LSQYYDQTQKANSWGSRTDLDNVLDLKKALSGVEEAMKEPNVASRPSQAGPFKSARKIRLPHTPLTPSIVADDKSSASITTAYTALRTRFLRSLTTKGFRSVLITSALEAEGKTLTAINLAISCARLEDNRVLLVDADLRKKGLTTFLNCRDSAGLFDVLGQGLDPDSAILATDLPNLYVLPAGSQPGSLTELFAGTYWKDFLAWTDTRFKLVLVDSPPLASVSETELISGGCDGVLMVVRAQSTKRDALQKVSQHLDRQKLLGVVFNSVKQDGPDEYYGERPPQKGPEKQAEALK
jgi:capsular exopolysaccharide synthesis family protein